MALARSTGGVIAVSGAVDYVTDGNRGYRIANGHKLMTRVTALGCSLNGVIAAFCVKAPVLEATAAALACYGLAGEQAAKLRDKQASDAELVSLARLLQGEFTPLGVKLIINDRLAVALASNADGLHVGQSDGSPAAMRDRLGPCKLLGLSVDTADRSGAIPPGLDYIGIGPVRATVTKPDHVAPIGFEGLAAIAARAHVPAFAIGGLGAGDAVTIKRAGAIGMAVVSAVVRAPDIVGATRGLLAEWRAA
jgi:thiamine-phosphate pyrophosphorylase